MSILSYHMGTETYYLSSRNSFIRSSISEVLSCSSGNETADPSEATFAGEAAFAASPDFTRAFPIQDRRIAYQENAD